MNPDMLRRVAKLDIHQLRQIAAKTAQEHGFRMPCAGHHCERQP